MLETILKSIASNDSLLRCDRAEAIAYTMKVANNPYADNTALEQPWLIAAYEWLDNFETKPQ